jgi:hypothetical protein
MLHGSQHRCGLSKNAAAAHGPSTCFRSEKQTERLVDEAGCHFHSVDPSIPDRLSMSLLEECRDGNAAAIAQLLDGGADVEAVAEERRPTVGDMVRIVDGEGKGSLATVTYIGADWHDKGGYYILKGESCSTKYYKEAQVSVQVTALTAAASADHVEVVRLLLERGAKADGESGAAALRAATSDDVKALLAPAGRSA